MKLYWTHSFFPHLFQVDNCEQYQFLYECVADYIKEKRRQQWLVEHPYYDTDEPVVYINDL